MSNVTIALGGRNFTVACAEGEEDHVAALGRMIAAKITAMGDLSGQSETRMLLFAALLLADELHEATVRNGAAPAPALPNGSAEKLDAIAERLENLAVRLEG
jgi:cell division protein ZapA